MCTIMKRLMIISLFAAAALCVSAQSRADRILSEMSSTLKSMGSYEVAFAVNADGYSTEGSYAVKGRQYALTFGDMDIFCDGATRYVVDKARREITVDRVNAEARNILDNPVDGLESIGEGYKAAVAAEGEGETTLLLTPLDKDDGGSMEVTIVAATHMPRRVVYKLGGESITFDLLSLKRTAAPLRTFDSAAYKGFEIIDFR